MDSMISFNLSCVSGHWFEVSGVLVWRVCEVEDIKEVCFVKFGKKCLFFFFWDWVYELGGGGWLVSGMMDLQTNICWGNCMVTGKRFEFRCNWVLVWHIWCVRCYL